MTPLLTATAYSEKAVSTTARPSIKLSAEHRAILLLWQRVNTSLSAYYKLKKYYDSACEALAASPSDWLALGIHAKHIARHKRSHEQQDQSFIDDMLKRMSLNEFQLLFQDQIEYPAQLMTLFDPPPLLFYRGNPQCLRDPQIAMVGSRKPTQKAQKFTFDMAQYLAQAGLIITSGLAQGVDAQAHLGALAQSADAAGRTIGVMGTGIDVCYPKQHSALFARIINEGGCVVSELLPGMLPHKHTFPRRNRLVSGLSIATIVTEAATKSGSLITARLTAEQGKQVFALPSTIDNVNTQGCHDLIREGATLIYHPNQVITDLSSQLAAFVNSQSSTTQVTAHQMDRDDDSKQSNKSDKSNKANEIVASVELGKADIDAKTDSEQASTKQTRFAEPDKNSEKSSLAARQSLDMPKHLQTLWVHLEFAAQDLDALLAKTELDTATLLSQLMELELLGAISQVAGRYQRAI